MNAHITNTNRNVSAGTIARTACLLLAGVFVLSLLGSIFMMLLF